MLAHTSVIYSLCLRINSGYTACTFDFALRQKKWRGVKPGGTRLESEGVLLEKRGLLSDQYLIFCHFHLKNVVDTKTNTPHSV